VQLVFKISNLCDHNLPTSRTDRRHAIAIPRFALMHRAVKYGVRQIFEICYTPGIINGFY